MRSLSNTNRVTRSKWINVIYITWFISKQCHEFKCVFISNNDLNSSFIFSVSVSLRVSANNSSIFHVKCNKLRNNNDERKEPHHHFMASSIPQTVCANWIERSNFVIRGFLFIQYFGFGHQNRLNFNSNCSKCYLLIVFMTCSIQPCTRVRKENNEFHEWRLRCIKKGCLFQAI